jgi:hypothetical protein
MYDEPGVGARSGMRVKDGAFDLDDFLEAGRRALNQGSSTRIGLAHQPYTDDDSDDESVGTARQAITSPRASSSMLIVESESRILEGKERYMQLILQFGRSWPLSSLYYPPLSCSFIKSVHLITRNSTQSVA